MTAPIRRSAVAVTIALLGSIVAVLGGSTTGAFADTDPAKLVGEGGAFLQPVTQKLIHDNVATPCPQTLCNTYTNVKLDSGIADFVGTAPNQFGVDFVVSERALSESESNIAKANGRSFAYVPIAATPVALATLVPNGSYSGGPLNTLTNFCTHIPLTIQIIGDIFGYNSGDPMKSWGDSRLKCSVSGGTLDQSAITLWANLDASMENFAVMSLLDSDPTTKKYFDDGLAKAFTLHQALTSSDTPSEDWPYTTALGGVIPGGDQPLIGKLLAINALSNAPSTNPALWQVGAIVPMASVWTGAPLGVPWNFPTAAVENAAGALVIPSVTSAAGAENDATLASNNLVTFNPSTTDAAAYNSYLMEESYLVVPTNGLSAVKAAGLAQFIRFALGDIGQHDISVFGAAPATPAMVTAGLKVAAQLDAQALAASSSSTGGSGGSGSGATTAAPGSTSTASNAGPAASTVLTDSGSSSGLAFSGTSNPLPLVGVGVGLAAFGALFRRRLKRRMAKP